MEILGNIDLLQVLQLEGLPVLLPHIFTLSKAVEVEDKVHQLLVCLIVIEWNDRDAVVKLVPERIYGIVYYNQVVKVSVGDNS